MRKPKIHDGEMIVPKRHADNIRIYVPPARAPRLPRDHAAMRPDPTGIGRAIVYVVTILALVIIAAVIHGHM